MAESVLNIRIQIDNKTVPVPYTPQVTTAEDVCITLCKQYNIGTVARHIFALREHGKQIFLMPSQTFEVRAPVYDLRIRFKVANVLRLKRIDLIAYDYYFHQARNDVLENKVPGLSFEKYRRELIGLGVTDMYRVMLEKDIPRETVESDYKKYIPKEVLKKHQFFIKKPIHDTLGKIRKAGHDAWYVKEEYLKQLEMMVPDYPYEEYKALMDKNGIVYTIHVRVLPYHADEPGVKYCFDSKKDEWFQICTIEELGFVSIRNDCTVQLSRVNGIPFYLKFSSLSNMYSFVSLLDGYYRLTAKWTFNICKDVLTPSLQRLYSMKCHGPVGGQFSYAKLEEKRNNAPGCFILRENEKKYNTYFLDLCVKDSLKPKTFKLDRLSGDEFLFNDDLTRYTSLSQLMASYKDPEQQIYLAECLPPSEYDKSQLLLCKTINYSGEALADGMEALGMPIGPICINAKDLQVYKDDNCLKWNKKRKMVKVNDTFESIDKFDKYRFPDESLAAAKKYCRNPDADPAGPWCFVEIEHSSEVEKMYCDIPFCDAQDCNIFSRNLERYVQYISFPKTVTNLSFGIKLWDPDSFLEAKAKLVLSILPLPISGQEIEDLGTGIEITLTNKHSALTINNKDSPEYEHTNAILKSTEYTFFTLSWDHGFITLNKENVTKPIFLQEFKTKGNLLSLKKDEFVYYSAMGDGILWSFPFCEDLGECDVHTTGSGTHQNFLGLRKTNVGNDLNFHVRATHSAEVILTPSPVIDFPNVKIIFKNYEGATKILCSEFAGGPTLTLKDEIFPNIISYFKWGSFSITIFSDLLQVYWNKDVGTFVIMEVKHEVIKSLRWFSPSSHNNIAHWTFYCSPPTSANPTPAYLPECALNEHETSYVGKQDLTSDGLPCIPWSGKKLIPPELMSNHEEKAVLEMYNYCRDPGKENKGTYCYTLTEVGDKRINKKLCKLRKCKSAECKMAGTGNDYIGKISRTRSNRTCQYWVVPILKQELNTTSVNNSVVAKNGSHKRTEMANDFKKQKQQKNLIKPEYYQHIYLKREVSEQKHSTHFLSTDYEDFELGLSTFDVITEEKTTEHDAVKEHFSKTTIGIENTNIVHVTSTKHLEDQHNLHKAGNHTNHIHSSTHPPNLFPHNKSLQSFATTISIYEIGNISNSINEYMKDRPQPDNARFLKVHEVNEEFLNGTLFADMSAENAANFCRNPSRSLAGSWCYTTDKDVPQEACYVPDCDKEEECTVIVKGTGNGRHVYILPQWKESGYHGGIRFSVKQWNPDLLEGLVFEIYPMSRDASIKLVIGAEHNEKIILYRDQTVLKKKSSPRIIPAGKWNSLWLQIRQGEIFLGYEGLTTTFFEWISENVENEFAPMFVNFKSETGHLLGVFFPCDEFQIENTTTVHFDKIMPIIIWTEKEQVIPKNLTLNIRAKGVVKVKFVNLPGSGNNHILEIRANNFNLFRNRNKKSELVITTESTKQIFDDLTWTALNVTFNEAYFNISVNDTVILSYKSKIPLLFYYFSVAVSENSWVAWVANRDAFDIDGPPKHGGWSRWSPWVCSVSCGGGEGYRTRTCSNPRPNIFGQMCHGSPTSFGICNEFQCGDVSVNTFDFIRHHLEVQNLSIIVKEGKTAFLPNSEEIIGKITAESPESYYDWIFNGFPLVLEPKRIVFFGDDISIKKTRTNDSGVYVCMLYRINSQRLIFHVVTLAVIPEKPSIITRESLPINLPCKGLSLGYAYSDLTQVWLLNNTEFINYGTTTLAAVSNEFIKHANKSLEGEWRCVIEQKELHLKWVTNIIVVKVKKAPNFYTYLMEDKLTKPIFGRLKSDAAINFVLFLIIVAVFCVVIFGTIVYLKWCRLPPQYKKMPKKNKKRNRRFEK